MASIRIKSILSLLLVVFAASCTRGGQPAPFEESKSGPSPGIATPPVSEALAKEASEEQIVYHIGPIDLPVGTDLSSAIEKQLTMKFQSDKGIWVTGFIPKVVDSSGAELPSALLNQAIVYNGHEENPLCPGNPNPFAIATSMMTKIELPQGYGYPILATDPLEAQVVLFNNTDKEYSGVFFELTLVARRMNEFTSRADVKPMLLEPDPCTHAPMEVPPNGFTEKNATLPVPQKSSLVLAQSALQDFGSSLSLTSGKEIMPFWRSGAILDEAHHITGMTANPFEDSKGIEFKAGDRITLGASYNNSSDKWLQGATAAAMVYLAPKD